MPRSPAPLSLPLLPRQAVQVDFDGGELSSDAGWLPLALADQRLRLSERLAQAVADEREPTQIRHTTLALFRERIYLIAQGYADANDAQQLRHDPLLKVAVGQAPGGPALAGQSTLSRFENAVTRADLERLGEVLLAVFLERCGPAPQQIVLDFDPFEDPCHGRQQGSLFHGHYDSHCYLPLYLCGSIDGSRQYVIGVLLRAGRATPVKGARFLLEQVVWALQARYPAVTIIVRGDSGYGNPKMLNTCRRLGVQYCFGKAQNARLHALSERYQLRAALGWTLRKRQQGPQAAPCRIYGEFSYQARSWRRPERVISKTEVTHGALNPRFVVTNLRRADGWTPKRAYTFYCARGEPENRIKEFKLDLAGDRLSCEWFLANQFRLVLHVAAYILYQTVQDTLAAVAPASEWVGAQVATIRVKLFKVAARVRARCRVVRVQLPTSYPWQPLWRKLLAALQPAAG
jgi:Transposase DDE domain group 1